MEILTVLGPCGTIAKDLLSIDPLISISRIWMAVQLQIHLKLLQTRPYVSKLRFSSFTFEAISAQFPWTPSVVPLYKSPWPFSSHSGNCIPLLPFLRYLLFSVPFLEFAGSQGQGLACFGESIWTLSETLDDIFLWLMTYLVSCCHLLEHSVTPCTRYPAERASFI